MSTITLLALTFLDDHNRVSALYDDENMWVLTVWRWDSEWWLFDDENPECLYLHGTTFQVNDCSALSPPVRDDQPIGSEKPWAEKQVTVPGTKNSQGEKENKQHEPSNGSGELFQELSHYVPQEEQ